MNIGNKIRELRKKRGITQEQLASSLHMIGQKSFLAKEFQGSAKKHNKKPCTAVHGLFFDYSVV